LKCLKLDRDEYAESASTTFAMPADIRSGLVTGGHTGAALVFNVTQMPIPLRPWATALAYGSGRFSGMLSR
jgi:hypothetical protein